MSHEIESALNTVCANFLADPHPIQDLKRLSGGASQEIWSFSTRSGTGPMQRFILRRAPSGKSAETSTHTISLIDEAELLKAVGQHLNAVPKVTYICRTDDRLGTGFIMDFVPGETIARKILRDEIYKPACAQLTEDCAQALAAIHAVPMGDVPKLAASAGLDQIVQYETIYRSMNAPRPVFELALQFLKSTPPAPLRSVLVHGDFRLGNLMVGEDGLRAVLDWELAHFGDPREDIAWICVNSWRFGQSQNRVGGFGCLSHLLEIYNQASGAQITEAEIDWWEILGTLKWGIMCMIMYERYRTGGDTSVERAAIGRRVSETEIDLVNLLEAVTGNA